MTLNDNVYEVREYTDPEGTRTRVLGYYRTDDVQKIGAVLKDHLDPSYALIVRPIPEPIDVSNCSPFAYGVEIEVVSRSNEYLITGKPVKTRDDLIQEVAGKANMSVDELRALFND